MPYGYLEQYHKTGEETYYKFLASSLKENNDLLLNTNDTHPYLYRATNMPDGSIPYVQEKLIGASAAVNQFCANGNFESTVDWTKNIPSSVTFTVSNNIATLVCTAQNSGIFKSLSLISGHKYLYSSTQKSTGNIWLSAEGKIYSSSNSFYTTSNIKEATDANYVISFYSQTGETENTLNIKDVILIDLTQMFGTAIADLAYSKEQASAGSGIAWLKSYGFFTKDYYPYNAGALQSVKAGSKKVVGKNLCDNSKNMLGYYNEGGWWTPSDTNASSNKIYVKPNTVYACTIFNKTTKARIKGLVITEWDKDNNFLGQSTNEDSYKMQNNTQYIRVRSYNSEASYITSNNYLFQVEYGANQTDYEPYKPATIYPLDSNLELRGLYKLDASNNIVCDGDEYSSDGSVKRRYGIVDLGSSVWSYDSSITYPRFYTHLTDSKVIDSSNIVANILCYKYLAVSAGSQYLNGTLGIARQGGSSDVLYIRDSSYTDVTTFKNSLNGVYLIYELATPTTDSAASYQNPQIIHENGTEEFIDTRDYPLPVGHDTGYFTASDEKFFLPPVVDNDGRFLYHDDDGFQFKNFNQVASKVEESDINGNIKIDSVETQVYDDSELQGIVDTDTTTATGNPINFSTKSAQNAVNTDIVIDPVQDLHGFTKPWVGGAGKNILKDGETSPISNTGFTATMNSDGSWTIGGGNTSSFFSAIYSNLPINFPAGTYTFSTSCSSGAVINGLQVWMYTTIDGEAGVSKLAIPASITITASSSFSITNMAFWHDTENKSFSGKVFMQLEKASSSTAWNPYTNICPISPKEQITVQGCGKNICPYIELGSLDQTTGEEISGNTIRTGFMPVNPNTTYILSGLSGTGMPIRMFDYGKSKTHIRNYVIEGITVKKAFITNNDTYYIRFQAGSTVMPLTSDIQVELGSQATSYEPYNLNTDLQIPLPNDFYGGTLNLESGELMVEKVIEEFDGSSDEEWTKWENNKYSFRGFTKNKHIQPSSDSEIVIGTVNNYLAIDSPSRVYASTADYSLSIDRHNTRFSVCINSDISTTALLREFLQNNVLQLCYSLATPYTIHLTPQQLNLLKATNNISTDAKTISVTYRNGELSTYAPATDIADGLLTATDKRAIDRTSEIAEGNPVQFSTESKQIARSTIIDLEPIQDLHGFSKPWVGGAGKNLLPLTLSEIKSKNTHGTWNGNVFTSNRGITFTILTDSDNNIIGIKANGQPSENEVFALCDGHYFDANTYILNGCPSSGGTETLRIDIRRNDNTGVEIIDTGNGGTGTLSNSELYRGVIRVGANVNINNQILYPMIRLSTVTDATFEPYTNIASISGYDEVDINGCGENLFDVNSAEANKRINITNGNTEGNSGQYASDYIPIKPLTQYTNNFSYWSAASYGTAFYDINKVFISGIKQATASGVSYTTPFTFTTPANAYYMKISTYGSEFPPENVKIELGSQATSYTPYQESNNISIQLDDTVYGGKFDVEKGELIVDRAIVDLGDLTWDDLGTAVSGAARFKTTLTNKPVRSDLTNGSTSYCSHYSLLTDGGTYTANKDGYTISTTDIVFFIDAYKTSSTSAFKTAMSGVQVVYTLQDDYKTTIKLSPHQINLLKGVNTITTNADSITLQYRNGEVATLEDLKILSDNLIAHTEDTEPYGFIEHMSILDPAQRIEYIGKNKNYKPVTVNLSGDHLANYNDWHDFFVLKENEPYMIKSDGTVDYALDPNDYTKKFDGSASDITDTTYTGGAFSWIPKIYKYEYVEGSDRYVYFSQKKLNDNYEAVGFIDENGLKHDGVWIPMFYGTEITQDGTVKIMSLATGTPSQSRDTATQKTYIENFSSQAKFFGGPIVNVLADLLIMLGKNSDIQAVFGTGNMSGGNGAQYMKANACLNGGAFYGSSTNTALNKAFHSLVLLTQNQWQRDPYTLCYKGEYIVSPYYKYDLTGASYVNTGVFVTPPSSNNWVYPNKSVSVPHWGAIPVGPYSGSTTTGWADGQYTRADQLTDTTVRVVLRFAYCTYGRHGGVRAVSLTNDASSTYWGIGASPLLLSKEKTPV